MSEEGISLQRNLFLIIVILAVFLIGSSLLILFLGFNPLVIIMLIFLVPFTSILIRYLFARYLTHDTKCPRCGSVISVYSEYCTNCGFKLLSKCPSCGTLMKFNDPACKNCGYRTKKLIIPENVDLKFSDKETTITGLDGLNYCPNCGVKLEPEQQNLRYCEICGAKLN